MKQQLQAASATAMLAQSERDNLLRENTKIILHYRCGKLTDLALPLSICPGSCTTGVCSLGIKPFPYPSAQGSCNTGVCS